MPDNQSQRPESPQLRRLQLPEQGGIRSFLRRAGPIILLVGLICTIGGAISFFSSFGSFEPPHYFWLCFVGIPLMFVGFLLSQFGYMGGGGEIHCRRSRAGGDRYDQLHGRRN